MRWRITQEWFYGNSVCLAVRLSIFVLALSVSGVSTVFNQLLSQEKASRRQEVVEFKYLTIRGLCVYRACPALCVCVRMFVRKTCQQKIWNSNEQNKFINFFLYYYCIKIVLDYKSGQSCQIKEHLSLNSWLQQEARTNTNVFCYYSNKTFFTEEVAMF